MRSFREVEKDSTILSLVQCVSAATCNALVTFTTIAIVVVDYCSSTSVEVCKSCWNTQLDWNVTNALKKTLRGLGLYELLDTEIQTRL